MADETYTPLANEYDDAEEATAIAYMRTITSSTAREPKIKPTTSTKTTTTTPSSATSSILYMTSYMPTIPKSMLDEKPKSSRSSAVPTSGAPLSTTKSKEEKTRDVEKRKEAIKTAFKVLLQSLQVELVFMVDCTGSMGPWITSIKEKIYVLFQERRRRLPRGASLRVAFVGYTDFDMPEQQRFKVLDFTTSADDFRLFLQGVQALGGGDEPEDIFGAFDKVFSLLSWSSEPTTKILIHIADAPCHGKDYNNCSYDSHTNPSLWAFSSHIPIMQRLHEMNIFYCFGYIKKESTEKMMSKFDATYFEFTGRNISVFDAQAPGTIMTSAATLMTHSVIQASTSHFHKEEHSAPTRKFTICKEEPDWSSIPTQTVTVEKQIIPPTLIQLLKDERRVKKITVKIKKAPNPFAEGGVRLAYYGIEYHTPLSPESSGTKKVVLKESKRVGAGDNAYKRFAEDVDTQTTAAFFANKFNAEGISTAKIKFNVAKIVSFGSTHFMASETFMEGKYYKYNSNNGVVCADSSIPYFDLLQCFSHYTYEKSEQTLIVVDLQGVELKSGEGVLLTDPAINSKNILRYGRTNLGQIGIRLFFETHECNSFCAKAGLPKRSRSDFEK